MRYRPDPAELEAELDILRHRPMNMPGPLGVLAGVLTRFERRDRIWKASGLDEDMAHWLWQADPRSSVWLDERRWSGRDPLPPSPDTVEAFRAAAERWDREATQLRDATDHETPEDEAYARGLAAGRASCAAELRERLAGRADPVTITLPGDPAPDIVYSDGSALWNAGSYQVHATPATTEAAARVDLTPPASTAECPEAVQIALRAAHTWLRR